MILLFFPQLLGNLGKNCPLLAGLMPRRVSLTSMPFHPRNKARKQQEKAPKRGGPKDQDDDDVDERGNIRGLIDYDYDSEDDETSSDTDMSMTSSELRALKKYGRLPKKLKSQVRGGKERPPPRKAAKKAQRRLRKTIIVSSDEEEEDEDFTEEEEEEEEESPRSSKRSRGKGRRRREESEEEEDEEDGETLGSQDTEDEEDEDEDYEEQEPFQGISIVFGGGDEEAADRMIPKRHNMKKESPDVKKFVKLITKPAAHNTIDDQIDQFKELTPEKRKTMLEVLEHRSDYVKKEQPLYFKLLQMKLSPETMAMVMARYTALNNMDPSSGEYYKLRSWMERVVSMPFGNYKEIPVRLEEGSDACGLFMEKARRCLDSAIYGQDEAKLQIQQFIASKIANPTASGLSLLLIGPPGIGKTSLIKNGIAKALDWPFQFISLGGDSDATTYTGHQYVYEGSHSGKIANCLAQAKSMSMVMMFDELDKISTTPKGEEIQNLLVHLTDPVQNMDFEDKYLSGIPLDMSRTMFVFSANDISKIDRLLRDPMVVVQLQGYETKEKLAIAEQFLLPAALREVNLGEKVAVTQDVLKYVLENYAKEETGVRELKRCLEQIAQRINMLRMFNVKELPFHIPGFQLPFVLKKEHVDLFLKKKEQKEKVPYGMYT